MSRTNEELMDCIYENFPVLIIKGNPIQQTEFLTTWRVSLLEICPVNRLHHRGMTKATFKHSLN